MNTLTGRAALMAVALAALVAMASASAGAGDAAAVDAVAVDRVAPHHVYVTAEFGGVLMVIDGETDQVIQNVPLGKRPRGLRLSPDGREIYVALSGSPVAGPGVDEKTLPPPDKTADGIGVVDVKTLTLRRVLRGVSDPEQLALSPDGRRLYVASEDTGLALVMDAASGRTLGQASVGAEPEGVAVSPDGREAYVTSETAGTVSALDARTFRVLATRPVGLRTRGVVFSADGARVYVTSEDGANLVVFDAKSHTQIATVSFPGRNAKPMGVVLSRDGRTMYVTTGRGRTVEAVDTASLAIKGSLEVGDRPWASP